MTIAEQIFQKVQALSRQDQKRILEIIEGLPSATKDLDKVPQSSPPTPRKTLLGRFAHRGVRIEKEEIDQARREMWSRFPRDFPEPKRDAS